MLAQRKFDLLVLDDGLNDAAAVGFCRQVREWDLITPIIIFTADGERDRVAGSGATAFLSKPDVFDQMLNTIDEYLPRRPSHRLRYMQGPRTRSTTIL